jgi:hypothetical protein
VAKHTLTNPDQKILFDDTEVLSNTQHYLTCLHREAIEIHKHKNCFNKKEESLRVKKSWYPALSACKTKLDISKGLNISQPDRNQSGSRIQIQGDTQLYNSWSLQTRLSMDQGSFREESSSNTGDFNSGGPVTGRKKTDFEDDIGRFEVWLSPPFATQKLPPQAASPSSRNRNNPAARRKKKDDTIDGIGL